MTDLREALERAVKLAVDANTGLISSSWAVGAASSLIRTHGPALLGAVRDAERWRAYVAGRDALDPSHVCRACGHPYTPEAGESEDCPNCGHDGTEIDATMQSRAGEGK